MTHLSTSPVQSTSVEKHEGYLFWDDLGEDLELSSYPQKREKLVSNIHSFFNEKSIDSLDISKVQKDSDSNYVIIPVGDELYYFDIYSEQYMGQSLDLANEVRDKNPGEEIKNILSGVPLLHSLMIQNSEQWLLGGYLTVHDTVESLGENNIYSGLSIKKLQMLVRQNIQEFEKKGGLLGVSKKQKEQIQKLYTQYLEIVMGIGDQYEEGSDYFYKSQGEIDLYIRSTIYAQDSFQGCLNYYTNVQTRMYDNWAKTKTNKKLYPLFSQKLSQIIFERFQKEYELSENTNDDSQSNTLIGQAVQFVEMITERSDLNINNSMRNPQLGEEICIYIITRKKGFLDSIDNSTENTLNFTDPIVGERSPETVISETETTLKEIGIQKPDVFLREALGISLIGLFSSEKTSTYEDLSLLHKREISLLARFLIKMKQGEFSIEQLKEKNEQEVQQLLIHISNEIYSEALEAVREIYDNKFSGEQEVNNKSLLPDDFVDIATKIGVSEHEIKAFTLYNDIRGNGGILDFSDEGLNMAESIGWSVGTIVASIAVVMAITALTGGLAIPALIPSLMVAGAHGTKILSLAGSLTAIGTGATVGTASNMFILDPRSHDSLSEMLLDVGTDFTVNTLHAIYMERITMAYWKGANFTGKTGLIGGDIGSGIGIEYLRESFLDSIFHSAPLLDLKTKSFSDALGYNGMRLLKEVPNELKNRFEKATGYYNAWEDSELHLWKEPEFIAIKKDKENILIALESWIIRQEKRKLS